MARWRVFDVNVWNTILSSVAPSTKKGYQNIFLQFVQFFEQQGFDFVSLNVNVMLSFLQKYVGKSRSSVKTAVAALKFFLRIYHREDLADHPLVALFSKGAQNAAPLPREKSKIWNPEQVLSNLKRKPRPRSFLDCAGEAILLLLLATGWRVDDVWKLSCKIEFEDDCARFFFREKRKCPIKGSITTSQEVARFKTEIRVCPIAAVERFMAKAKPIRILPSNTLFVSSTGLPASKDTLRRWVVDLLASVDIFASAGSCRSAATSAAFAENRKIDDIMRSAGWSSESTFRRFYHREVLPLKKPLNLMSK
jgi:site-specific recombinase XerD